MRARIALALTVVAVAIIVPLVAGANHVVVRDGNDVRGLLDIRRVTMTGGRWPTFKVGMRGRWTNREIFERGFILVFFDVRNGERGDYYALARSTGGNVVANLYRDRQFKSDRHVRSLSEWRAGPKSISIKVPLSSMKFDSARVFYRWYAETVFTGDSCRRVCLDFAPNGDAVVEPRPGATPSPTVTTGATSG
ncbi:MAG: hypothetical protein ACRDJV_13835 [Actinomycetota bacterium]